MSECSSCWWQEGGKCYLEPVTRAVNGLSTKVATKKCDNFLRKRKALSEIIPNQKLIILSEFSETNSSK